jgi:hypothetical protein
MEVATDVERVWGGLALYEQLVDRPSPLLRLLLPRPVRAEGRKSEVGDVIRCIYDTGYLLKRVTRMDAPHNYEFDVVEQVLRVGGRIRLLGGRYTLRPIAADRTLVELETRFVSPRRPRWLWRSIEGMVCHMFHRHILRSMRSNLPAHDRAEPKGAFR